MRYRRSLKADHLHVADESVEIQPFHDVSSAAAVG
jgi:hypothetical protein